MKSDIRSDLSSDRRRSQTAPAVALLSSLDPEASNITLGLLRQLCREEGIGVLCSLHQVELARRFADRIVGMRAGRVVLEGPPDQFSTEELDALYVDAHSILDSDGAKSFTGDMIQTP